MDLLNFASMTTSLLYQDTPYTSCLRVLVCGVSLGWNTPFPTLSIVLLPWPDLGTHLPEKVFPGHTSQA